MAELIVPDHLLWIGSEPGCRAWLDRLPGVVSQLSKRWSLTLGEMFDTSHVSYVVAAVRADGSPAALKVQFPHRECEHEAAALQVWDGDGAIMLLDHAPELHGLLLERCVPGTPLSNLSCDAALDVYCQLLPRLWKTTNEASSQVTSETIGTLRDEAEDWSQGLVAKWNAADRPIPRYWIDVAVGLLRDLANSQREPVLLHQDLHADNVLCASREPWLAIDPKPLLGEREFSVAPIVRSRELGHSRQLVLRRLDRLTADLDLDRERARGWTIAQTVAWGIGSTHVQHHDTIRWLLEL